MAATPLEVKDWVDILNACPSIKKDPQAAQTYACAIVSSGYPYGWVEDMSFHELMDRFAMGKIHAMDFCVLLDRLGKHKIIKMTKAAAAGRQATVAAGAATIPPQQQTAYNDQAPAQPQLPADDQFYPSTSSQMQTMIMDDNLRRQTDTEATNNFQYDMTAIRRTTRTPPADNPHELMGRSSSSSSSKESPIMGAKKRLSKKRLAMLALAENFSPPKRGPPQKRRANQCQSLSLSVARKKRLAVLAENFSPPTERGSNQCCQHQSPSLARKKRLAVLAHVHNFTPRKRGPNRHQSPSNQCQSTSSNQHQSPSTTRKQQHIHRNHQQAGGTRHQQNHHQQTQRPQVLNLHHDNGGMKRAAGAHRNKTTNTNATANKKLKGTSNPSCLARTSNATQGATRLQQNRQQPQPKLFKGGMKRAPGSHQSNTNATASKKRKSTSHSSAMACTSNNTQAQVAAALADDPRPEQVADTGTSEDHAPTMIVSASNACAIPPTTTSLYSTTP